MTRAAIHLRFGWLTALPLTLCIVTLPCLCHASPLYPTWIAGLNDDADHDDVVLEVIGTVALPAPAPPQVAAPAEAHAAPTAIAGETPSKRSAVARLDRAPPPA